MICSEKVKVKHVKFTVFFNKRLKLLHTMFPHQQHHKCINNISVSKGRFGLQRSASMEFKDLTKKDAQISLAMELDKLSLTSPTGAREEVEQNLDGFKRLFGKFITSSGPSVQWDKIEKLPPNAVRDLLVVIGVVHFSPR